MKNNIKSNSKVSKKIGFLINNMSAGGGTERVTSIIANGLEREMDEIFIFSCKECKNSKFELNENVNIISLANKMSKNIIMRKLDVLKKLNKYVQKYEIDILIAVDTSLFLYILPIKVFNYRRNIKIVSWEHFNFYSKRSFLGKIAQHLSVRYSDALIVLGKKDKENYLKNMKHIKNIDYIYNPIAVNLDKKSLLEKKVVLAVGRLVEQKGFDMLINAWRIVEQSNKEWKLNIIGSGPEEDNLKKQIKRLELNNIEIIPFQKEIEKFYLNSSMFVLSSRYEGFVLVLLEAQAKGLPVISFDCKEGPAEIVDNGVNGYLVEPNNVEMLAKYILKLIDDENLRYEFSSKSQKDLGRFNTDIIIEKWIKLFKDL